MKITTTRESRYQGARIVSEKVEIHFAEHLEAARKRGEENLAPEPDALAIEAMIDIAFWASLQREEGRSPKISLAYLPPEKSEHSLLFEQRLPLNPGILTKLSPGVERAGIHLGVWYHKGELYVWGTTLKIPNFCFVLDVSEPGLLVIKHRRLHGLGKFANVAVLIGDQIKVVNENSATHPDAPALLKALLGFNDLSYENNYINVLVQLAVSMRSHRHGGTLLVVPKNTETWRASIIHPIKYSVNPPYSEITKLIHQDKNDKGLTLWQDALRKEIDSMAGYTAIDGATIINDQYELLAFGTKISRADGKTRVEQISYNEPIVGGETTLVNPGQSGGTRHLSAAQFVHDQQDALALVASQDGHFTIFSWSQEAGMVQAHRIDTLLL